MKKNKIFRKAMSVLLSFAILVGTVSICLPILKIDAGAVGIKASDGTEETITQTQIVTSNRDVTYDSYAAQYLNGAGESTGIVIPGLQESENYVIQGMTYYPQKDWMLVTAYHSAGTYSSKVFCLDAKTGEFVAVLAFKNVGSETLNKDHGGGIAISEHNIYYSCGDKDRKIAYAPLSALNDLGTNGVQYIEVQLVAEAEFTEVGSVMDGSKTAYTAYVCYDQGYLWMGNFYDRGAILGGVTVAAADYNAPAVKGCNSMVYGYKLKGDKSADEWNNLINGPSDCKGSPTHALALDNNIKDVQYAVVDNGKLYLSCSYGSGAGLSITFGFGETSKLITADIDLSAQPTEEVQISTSLDNSTFSTIKAHKIDTYETYDMMPMSEGLCIINDLIFCTFESASKKYLKDGGGGTISIGNCEKPVDVIWKIDPYELENKVRVEDPPYSYYEKVNSLDKIEDGEEYLIVYESPVKDPVTQRNILYALDANGGYKDYRLSKKNSSGENSGYTGAIGHPITEYSIEDGKLYLGNAEKDDVKNVRWKLNSLGNGAYSIQSPDYYFVNQPNLYCDASTISMATDAVRGTNMKIQESGKDEDGKWIPNEGGFWISNGDYFLWCNDGTTESYNTAYNSFYGNSANAENFMYAGVTEQAGTFHTDALNKSDSNVLGGTIVTLEDTFYAHGLFNIYKRVVDRSASTFESRVYTDMKASLQSDGTYTIDLETYAISPNHYMPVDDRPTDYIIVMDKSQSTSYTTYNDCDSSYSGATLDGTDLREWGTSNTLSVNSLCREDDTKTPASGEAGVNGYAFSKADEQIYMKHSDGKYYRVYLAIKTISLSGSNPNNQFYWAYYVADDGLYYVLQSEGESDTGSAYVREGITKDLFYERVDNSKASSDEDYNARQTARGWPSGTSTRTNNTTSLGTPGRRQSVLYTGVHYTYTCGGHDANITSRIDTIKAKASEFVGAIGGLGSDNRIAIAYYDASAHYLKTDSTWSTSDYTNVFWDATEPNIKNLQAQIYDANNKSNGISSVTDTAQSDNTGLEMAIVNNIMDGSGEDYKATGVDEDNKGRNCVVIFMSDGLPGADGSSDTTNAANNVITKAHDAKEKGAFIFTAMVGEAGSTKYMDAVSSKYPGATSLNDMGGASVDGVNYTVNLADITFEKFQVLGETIANEVVKNRAVALANLSAESILNEELTKAFKPIIDENGDLIDGIDISHVLVPGTYDKVERFSFNENEAYEDNDIKVVWGKSNSRRITVTGYDYGEQYISKEKTGYKLKITITGVEADEEADITNTSINNTTTTAIYQTDSSGAFKYFPTEYFNIPTYTYVLDYDLPMYDKDINGTLCSVDGGLNRQDPDNYSKSRVTENVALEFTADKLDMTYKLVSTGYTEENNRSFCLIERDDGTYDWFRINIVPASNVLFEENRFATSTAGSEFNKSSWATVKAEDYESAEHQSLSGDNDRYGYDENYANNGNNYSNGTAYKTTVNSTKKRSDTMTFSYTGTGFDLMAACGANTGVQLVNIKKADGTIEKVFMVDTYYVDTENYDGALLNQVPIVSYKNEDGHGDYTVEVTAAYLSNAQGVTSGRAGMLNKAYTAQNLLKDMGINMPLSEVELVWFNDNSILNGGTGPVAEDSSANRGTAAAADVALDCYIDSIRVYNPLGSDSSHYINSEKGATYYNIVNELDPKEDGSSNGNIITGEVDENGNPKRLFAYVVGDLKADGDGNIPVLSFDNYQSVGPQNEIYLQSATDGEDSHAVAFNVAVPNSYSRVMISLRAVDGATTAIVASGENSIEFEINTATEQYFDITPYLDINTSTGVANVVITNKGTDTNNGKGLLSVNNLKLVDATAQVVTSEDLPVMARSLSLRPTRVDPNSYDYDGVSDDIVIDNTQQPEVDTPVDDNTDVEVPVVVENIFTRIVAFFKKLFGFIFSI